MKKLLVLAAALLALPAPSEAAQARRVVDDVVDALRRLKRGERVRLPRAETFEHKLLRGTDGKFRSTNDLMRPGAIDESLLLFRHLDDGVKAVVRSKRRIFHSDDLRGGTIRLGKAREGDEREGETRLHRLPAHPAGTGNHSL